MGEGILLLLRVKNKKSGSFQRCGSYKISLKNATGINLGGEKKTPRKKPKAKPKAKK